MAQLGMMPDANRAKTKAAGFLGCLDRQTTKPVGIVEF
jgi:hypothetical protein